MSSIMIQGQSLSKLGYVTKNYFDVRKITFYPISFLGIIFAGKCMLDFQALIQRFGKHTENSSKGFNARAERSYPEGTVST